MKLIRNRRCSNIGDLDSAVNSIPYSRLTALYEGGGNSPYYQTHSLGGILTDCCNYDSLVIGPTQASIWQVVFSGTGQGEVLKIPKIWETTLEMMVAADVNELFRSLGIVSNLKDPFCMPNSRFFGLSLPESLLRQMLLTGTELSLFRQLSQRHGNVVGSTWAKATKGALLSI